MTDDTILPYLRWSAPDIEWGVMLLAMAEWRLGLADKLARVFPDRRDRRSS